MYEMRRREFCPSYMCESGGEVNDLSSLAVAKGGFYRGVGLVEKFLITVGST